MKAGMLKTGVMLTLAAAVLAGCSVGTKYTRPELETPAAYRGGTEAPAGNESAAMLKWWDVYEDETLRELIRTALENNYDVKVAAARVEESRALAGVSGVARIPQVSVGANASRSRKYVNQPGVNPETGDYKAVVDASYEVDLWGRLASLDEAARANLLSSEYAAETVRTALISDVATAYFDLLASDRELEIADRTVENRREFLELTNKQFDQGTVSMLEVGRAAASLSQAAASVPDIKRRIEQTENRISILLGNPPGPVTRTKGEDMPVPPDVPAGLPSELVERRPDIRQAEADLMAANAQVNATKALLYPTITLTGQMGIESGSLRSLFGDPTGIWSVAAGILQPILNANRTGYQVDAAQARKDQATLRYYDTLVRSFRDVSDALVARTRYAELEKVQKLQVEQLHCALDLATTRYKAGYSAYFEVIEADGALFSAELGQVQARRNALVSAVSLYKALGGGWGGDTGETDGVTPPDGK